MEVTVRELSVDCSHRARSRRVFISGTGCDGRRIGSQDKLLIARIAHGGLTPSRSPGLLLWNLIHCVIRMAVKQFVVVAGTQWVEVELVDEAFRQFVDNDRRRQSVFGQ